MTAKTSTERSRERRERLKAGAVSEVRGIHAPPDDHPTIREAAKRLADRLVRWQFVGQALWLLIVTLWEQGEQPEPDDHQHAGDFPERDDEQPERLPDELPAHHPLMDARQSARQLLAALKKA